MNYPFALDEFQEKAIASINNNNNVLVTAHTGSGKTVIAEHAILYNMGKNDSKHILYISPIKSLSNEKYKDFTQKFKDYSVGILTGDNKINPDANIIIATAEIIRNDFYLSKALVNNISCAIFDEIHYINDAERGIVWEEIIINMDASIQLVMLSATIDKADEFAKWISDIKHKQTDLITTSKRIIPLTHYIYIPHLNVIHKIVDNSNTFYEDNYNKCVIDYKKDTLTINSKIKKLISFLQENNMFQTIVFSFSRNKCEYYANILDVHLTNPIEEDEIEAVFNDLLFKYKEQLSQLNQYNNLLMLAKKGIAYHHSGLVPLLKETIEIIFKKGLIKLLFATETFAVGVNMPTRTVVLTDIYKNTNKGKRLLNSSEYKQISGRAGRRGTDSYGNVILLPIYDIPNKDELLKTMLGKLPCIVSKFAMNYSILLKTMKNNVNIIDIFKNTLLSKENASCMSLIANEKIAAEKELDKLQNTDISADAKTKFDEYLSMEKKQGNFSSLNFKMDRKQEKKYKDLKKYIFSDTTHKEQFFVYRQINELSIYIANKKDTLDDYMSFVEIKTKPLIEFLQKYNYIQHCPTIHNPLNACAHNIEYKRKCPISHSLLDTFEDKSPISSEPVHCSSDTYKSENLTAKGNFGVFINECNFIMITEMLTRGYLDNLSSHEIVAIFAIFVENNKVSEQGTYSGDDIVCIETNEQLIENTNININKYTNNAIVQIIALNKELKNDVLGNSYDDYWKIVLSFVMPAFMWATGKNINEIKTLYDIYEGNFIRNVLKISNIVNEILSNIEIINKQNLIPKLQNINNLIIRDIVTVSSLYL